MKDYHSTHRVVYEPPNKIGYCSLPVLGFLVGQPWDQLALDLVESVEPTCIRVTRGAETTDSIRGRVTVHVDEKEVIRSISQEVTVGLEGGYDDNGPGAYGLLQECRKRGINV